MFADNFLVIAATGNPLLDTLSKVLGVSVGFLVAFTVIFWISLIVWTFRDIRSRTQDFTLQIAATLLVAIFFIGGLFIYLILRPRQTLGEIYERQLEEESLLAEMTERQTCNNCHARVEFRLPDLPLLRSKAQASLPQMRTTTGTTLGILSILRHKRCLWANAEHAWNASHAK